jgi:hypothetical protein
MTSPGNFKYLWLAFSQREETDFGFLSGPVAFPAASLMEQRAPPTAAGRRPTIARGLVLSVFVLNLSTYVTANIAPFDTESRIC